MLARSRLLHESNLHPSTIGVKGSLTVPVALLDASMHYRPATPFACICRRDNNRTRLVTLNSDVRISDLVSPGALVSGFDYDARAKPTSALRSGSTMGLVCGGFNACVSIIHLGEDSRDADVASSGAAA